METALIIAVLVMAVALLVLVVTALQTRRPNVKVLDERLDSLNQRLGEVSGQASTYRETVDAVNQTLGGLTQTSQQMLELGRDMQQLQNVLAAPTLRGGLGEQMLEELLRQTHQSACMRHNILSRTTIGSTR